MEEAVELFANLKDHTNEARMRAKIGQLYEQQENYRDALPSCKKARALYQQIDAGIEKLKTFEAIARLTRRLDSDPASALGYYIEALTLAQKLNDPVAEDACEIP